MNLSRPVIIINKETEEEIIGSFDIFEPYPIDNGENFMCRCSISGLVGEEATIGGIDSIQAVELAMIYLDTVFNSMLEKYDFLYLDRTQIEFFLTPHIWPNT
jgi:hypothetical protein